MARPRNFQLTWLHSPLPVNTLRITSVTGVNCNNTSSGAPQAGIVPGGKL